MVNKRAIKRGAALLLMAVLAQGQTACAEEKRLGDYIYVPAMQASSEAGTITLRVEGHAIQAGSGETQIIKQLAGAEFGVYVYSGYGKLTPWANPLYPSEPMRIRTGEGETRFSLPQGPKFYLRQESAPQGYLFDRETLIPVTGEEIVVSNAMAGQLAVRASDSLGVPIAGIVLDVEGENGEKYTLTTDENGEALLSCEQEQRYTVREQTLPEGVFAARASTGGEATEQGVMVYIGAAQRAQVTFEHPASGSVLLDMQLSVIDGNAQIRTQPLENVRLEIKSDPAISVVTDALGQARASLLEGTYPVRLGYEGEKDVLLPVSEGQILVASGSTTKIELTATETTGRIELTADGGAGREGVSVTLRSQETGQTYGPYALDAGGAAVTEPLEAGEYRIAEVKTPADMQPGSAWTGEAGEPDAGRLSIAVSAGQVTQVGLELLTREKQTFGLLEECVSEQGETALEPMKETLRLTLLDENGQEAGSVDAVEGVAGIEALSGSYTLRLSEEDAQRLDVLPVSRAFDIPDAGESVTFVSNKARVCLSSVDENGAPAPGAVYQLTDSTGTRHEVSCDADGLAVSALLAAGEVRIETLDAPKGHAAAAEMTVTATAGEAARITMEHERFGSATVTVRMQSLDENGGVVYTPVAGVPVNVQREEANGTRTAPGLTLTTDEDGCVTVQPEAGVYVASIGQDALSEGCRAPQEVRLEIRNTQQTEAALTCMDAEGGVRVSLAGGSLSDEELAQVRFELRDAEGHVTGMTMQDSTFYAGALTAGEYTLHQMQMPQGYTLSAERTIAVTGGEVTAISVPLEEYAVLTVSRTGLTFDSAMRTYVVPLTGQYGVYTLEDGEMKPYPDADTQVTLWSNVTPQEIAEGKQAGARLPAAVDGTVYYLHELGSAAGFAADDTYYEATLHAGETVTLNCAVSSDRGFFVLDTTDVLTGAHVTGGTYELTDKQSGESLLRFDMGEEAYQNAMAVPVGSYVLRQIQAAPGYALSVPAEMNVTVEPYLTQGGYVTKVHLAAQQVPEDGGLEMIEAIYAAQQQGLTLLSVETGAMEGLQTLLMPSLTIELSAVNGERSDISGVVLSGAGDAAGDAYRARVEYCLVGGGWQPSDARETGVLEGPTAVSLSDVSDDIRAVRVTYIHAQSGREETGAGFTPGQVTLSVRASAQGDTAMEAGCTFEGVYAYQTEQGGEARTLLRSAQAEHAFTMQASGLFETVSAGRDGRITGVAFFDENADGEMGIQEAGRYAGMTVSLQTPGGDVVAATRTDANGRYAFGGISSGEYRVRFDAGENVVFSTGSLQSSHRISGVEDKLYGMSGLLSMDGSHTDYVVNVGCLYAAQIEGALAERLISGELVGMDGLTVEMRALDAGADEEPVVVITGGMGEFSFGRILPGTYEVLIDIPQGYLCAEAADAAVKRTITLEAGETHTFGVLELEKDAAISGAVRVDDDGDGVFGAEADVLSGVRVALLRASDGHTEVIEETTTDESGAYAFHSLRAGEYSVLFELDGEWAFTRYGEDSCVYGAVSQSGTTRTITLRPGETAQSIDAGVTIPAKLTVAVFCDTQYDGQKSSYEAMLSGAAISLIRLENGEDAEEIAYTTDSDGLAVFEGVSPGEYVIAYHLPGQWRTTKQVDNAGLPTSYVAQSANAGGRSLPFTLAMGSNQMCYIGAMLSGSISGTVFYDDDADANRDEGEAICTDVQIELRHVSGETVALATPDADGGYAFEGLAPGRYIVGFTAQEGSCFSGTERTMTRGGVQMSETNVSATRPIAVAGGEAVTTAHAGVVRLCSMSGTIWEDRSGDRVMQADEAGLQGVHVYLMDGAGRNILQSTETDETGAFALTQLKPGTYRLRVDAPGGYVFSGALEGSALALESQRDSRAYTQSFTLRGGVTVDGLGFGMLTQGTIAGTVWEDTDFDGLMGSAESGMRGVTVTLLDENGEELAQKQTIRSGEFRFDQLMPGHYRLLVTLPEGYRFTAEGGDSLAARTEEAGAVIDPGMLTMGEVLSDIRVGMLKTASLGGVVWMDADDDGKRANEEAGLEGVRVLLTQQTGADAGRMLKTVTDEGGAYRFDDLMPGDAVLTFTLPEGHAFARSSEGTRRVSSVPAADALTASTDAIAINAGDMRLDVDAGVVGVGTVSGMVWEDREYDGQWNEGEDGVRGALVELVNPVSGEAVRSAETAEDGSYALHFVRKGEYTLRVTLPDGRIFTRDGESVIAQTDASSAQTGVFALAMGEGREDLRVGAIVPAHITGRVAIDENGDGVCGEDEPGLKGAAVTAMQGGTVVATAYADETGAFSFDLLRPGTYRLRYVLGKETFFAAGVPLYMTDADAQEGETGEVTLAMGERARATAIAVELAGRIAGCAFEDANVNGALDEGELAMSGILVELLDGKGELKSLTYIYTKDKGHYAFERLRAGTYSVRFTLPDTMLFTDYTGRRGDSGVPVTEGNVGATDVFALAMGENRNDLNVGGIHPGRIGDTVWHDTDGNGLQDYKEPLIPGIALELMRVSPDGTMEPCATTVSDRHGYYAFEALRPGTYVLRMQLREGDTLTERFGAPLGEIDSDLDPETGMSAPIELRSGQVLRSMDVGLIDYAK